MVDESLVMAQLPSVLANEITVEDFPCTFFSAKRITHLCQRLAIDRAELGRQLLPVASAFSYAPISQFAVGAVVLDSIGNMYLGANMEFLGVHIGQVIHAEQSAIAQAWSHGARDIALLIVSHPPCGHCRQFIKEVKRSNHFAIMLPEQVPEPLSVFLPSAFGAMDLGIDSALLDTSLDLSIFNTEGIDLRDYARHACEASHAPYSHCHSGIALTFASDEEIVVGAYAENAAFNPSLPPLQVALNNRRLQGKPWHDIQYAVMVEKAGKLSQQANTAQLLNAVASGATLEVFEK